MAPRTRFTSDIVLDAALAQTRASGISSVSARSIAASLGASIAPVFTAFSSMDALHERLMDRIISEFVGRAGALTDQDDPLWAAGEGWLRFALEEPRLYEAIFLTVHPWHSKWGPIRRQLAERLGEHPRYAALPLPVRFALVGRASIVLHGLGLELWSGRLRTRDLRTLVVQLVQPVVDAALQNGWTVDLHLSVPSSIPLPQETE
jgi:AcrR family transcriptional regulator